MQKDHVRDYATEAFRYYASLGRPTYEELKRFYYKRAMDEYEKGKERGSNVSRPTENQILYAENRLQEKMAELQDILAVERTLKQLHEFELEAVEAVYFVNASKPIKRNEISERVLNCCNDLYCDVRTIYRYLNKARMIFAYERGLRR